MKNSFTFILYSIYGLIVVGLVLLFVAPPIPGVGKLEVKIVKSGSMEPAIMTGAVVVIKEKSSYQINDIITFADGGKIPTTHRIIGVENVNGTDHFITKGDANEERDNKLVSPSNILGKVVLGVPYAGFLLDFARQPVGFALLIGIPAFLIVVDELDKIWREVRRVRRVKFTKEIITPLVIAPYQPNKIETNGITSTTNINVTKIRLMDIRPIAKESTTQSLRLKSQTPLADFYHDIKKPHLTMMTSSLVLVVFFFGQVWGQNSLSYFFDTEASVDNRLSAQVLDFSLSPMTTNFSIADGELINDNVAINFQIENISGDGLQYDVAVAYVGGDFALCQDIVLNTNSPLIFSGSLLNLLGTNILFNSPWQLNFSLANNTHLVGENCVMDVVFEGYLDIFSEKSGYVDTEAVRLSFVVEEGAFTPVSLMDSSGLIVSQIVEDDLIVSQTVEENNDVFDNNEEDIVSKSEPESESELEPKSEIVEEELIEDVDENVAMDTDDVAVETVE